MEKTSTIEKKEPESENALKARPSISSFATCYFGLLGCIIIARIVWDYIFSFDVPWPGKLYPSLNRICLYGLEYTTKGEIDWWKNGAWYNIFKEYASFKYFLGTETLFHFLPFFVASLTLCFIKQNKWKKTAGILFGLLIFCLQLQFGYLCYEAWQNMFLDYEMGTISQHIFLYGGFGVLLAVTYGVVLYFSYKFLMKSPQTMDEFKATLLAHLPAYLASSIVLAIVWIPLMGFVVILIMALIIVLGIISGIIFGIIDGIIGITKIVKKKRKKNRSIALQ